jgi:hypothetical protein
MEAINSGLKIFAFGRNGIDYIQCSFFLKSRALFLLVNLVKYVNGFKLQCFFLQFNIDLNLGCLTVDD